MGVSNASLTTGDVCIAADSDGVDRDCRIGGILLDEENEEFAIVVEVSDFIHLRFDRKIFGQFFIGLLDRKLSAKLLSFF
jgi:hypothetical protein